MSRLLRIDLAFCSLTGNLPNNLFLSLTSLVKIQLCCQKHKGIDGSIPPSIFDLKNLRVLSLGENRLSGEIPRAIGKLKKVWFLDLEFMSLSGNISIFGGMTSLEELHLTYAGIYGDIPDKFGSYFPHMNECQLRNNSITGFIPTSVKKMKNLTKLILCGNFIRGTLPKELSELPLLRILDLSHNNLQRIEDGTLDFNGSPKLEILLLRNNPSLSAGFDDLVSALIPKDPVQNPSALRILDISHCDFAGTIPPLIWMLPSLIEMNLKHNRIGGRIPEVLDDIMFLTYIDFSENQLEGPIPDTFVLLQSLWVFDIRKNPSMRAPTAGVNESSGVIQDLMRTDPNSGMKGDSYTCPFAKFLSNNGSILLDPSYYYSKFCVCDHGFFGHLGRCKKCVSGGDCPNKSSMDMNPKIYLNIKKGYWPCPSADNATHLIRCPGRMTVDKDLACNPSGHCRCWLNTTDLRTRTVCNKSCICHSGNTDRLCSKCEKGYFKNGYICKECSGSSSLSPYIAIPIVICCLLFLWGVFRFCQERIKVKFSVVAIEFIILIVLRAMQVISGWIFEVSIVLLLFYMAGIMKNTRGLVTILVFHFQVLDAVISSTETSLPDFLFSIQHYMSSIFNLNFPGISCSLHVLFTPLGKYLVIILFPLGCLLIIWTYYGIRVMIEAFSRVGRVESLETVKFQCQKVSITCLVLTYFPIVKHSLAVISPCNKDEDTGSFMRVAPWIMCDSNNTTYETLKILGWLSVIIYGVFVPAMFFSLLRWYKFNKNQFSDDQRKLCDSWLGAIYLPYKDNVQSYFEVMKLARKLVIAGLITFIPNTSSIQTFTIAFLLMAAVVYQLEFKPYAKHEAVNFENSLETLSLVVLQQSVILLRFTSYDTESSEGLIWIVIAVNALVLVAFMVAFPSVLINLCSASEPVNETTPLLVADGQTANATNT
jgi:hypothetical protein